MSRNVFFILLLSFFITYTQAQADIPSQTQAQADIPSQTQAQADVPSQTQAQVDILNQTSTERSILDELGNWYVPDMSSKVGIQPRQFAASCDMLCAMGWEDDLTTSPFTRRKIMRCNPMNLTKVIFTSEECNPDTGMCSRILESSLL